MNETKLIFSPSLIQRIIWWSSGATISILLRVRSDWQKFFSIGSINIFSSTIDGLMVGFACSSIFNEIYIPILLGGFWAFLMLSINRFLALSIYSNRGKNFFYFTIRTLIALFSSIIISFPLQLIIFKQLIEFKLQPVINPSLLEKVVAFQKITNENFTIEILSISIFLLFIIIDLIPLLLIWLSPRSAYEDSFQFIQKTEIQDFITQIESKQASLYNEIQDKINKRQEMSRIPFGGFEFYIDYNKLPMNDIYELLENINNIYNAIYKIDTFNEVLIERPNYELKEIFKTHPEDVLLIHSIETGNSVTFKVSTGWQPKFELIDNDLVISLPQGSVSLLIVTYLLKMVFDYSISNYKQLLEIQKLERENQALENQVLKDKIEVFNVKLKKSDERIQKELQHELNKFHSLTLGNGNFIQTKITQDSLVVDKLKRGKLALSTSGK